MAQTGYTPILIYASGTTGNTPLAANLTSSASGAELALNYFDGKLFYKDASGVVQVLAGKGGSGVVAGSNTQVQFNNNGVFGASVNMTFNGTRLSVADFADASLTAGRVTYAGAGGNLTDSANLTFDGTTLTAAGLAGPHNGTVGATTPNTGAFTTLSASSTVSGAGFSTYLASPPAIGGTAANTGAFTTLAASGAVTLSGGTANGVAYLNGSKVLTTGSALVFDGSNLGLGVTPSAWGSGNKAIQLGTSSVATTALVDINNNTFLMNGAYFDGASYRYVASSFPATRYLASSGAHSWSTAPSGTAGNAISFTQAMTLDASGRLLLGTTSIAGYQNVGCFVYDTSNGAGYANHASDYASGSVYWGFGYNGSGIGSITQSGTTAVLYNVTSDQRLKENIVDAPEFGSVIDSIKVRSYDWKADGNHQRAGFIAQELVTVAPEAVHQPEDPEEMMAVDYSKLVPMLVKEIQSLRARVAQLEGKV